MIQTLLGRRGRLAQLLLGMLAGVVLVLIVYAVVITAVNSSETNERGEARATQNEVNDETLRIIRDCTQPSGDCFKKAQARTAKAVGDINRVIILAAACASKPYEQTVEQVADCVTRRLADSQPLS